MDKDLVIKMRNREIKLDREGEYWTDEEREKLRQYFREGIGITEIALLLQRKEQAVSQQMEILDLYDRKMYPTRRKNSPKEPCCLCSFCNVDPASCPMGEHCPKLKEDK